MREIRAEEERERKLHYLQHLRIKTVSLFRNRSLQIVSSSHSTFNDMLQSDFQESRKNFRPFAPDLDPMHCPHCVLGESKRCRDDVITQEQKINDNVNITDYQMKTDVSI